MWCELDVLRLLTYRWNCGWSHTRPELKVYLTLTLLLFAQLHLILSYMVFVHLISTKVSGKDWSLAYARCKMWKSGVMLLPSSLKRPTDILSMRLVNCDFVVLFCTGDIYCTSVRPARGIVLCGSSKMLFHCTDLKAHWGNSIVSLFYINKNWFDLICKGCRSVSAFSDDLAQD